MQLVQPPFWNRVYWEESGYGRIIHWDKINWWLAPDQSSPTLKFFNLVFLFYLLETERGRERECLPLCFPLKCPWWMGVGWLTIQEAETESRLSIFSVAPGVWVHEPWHCLPVSAATTWWIYECGWSPGESRSSALKTGAWIWEATWPSPQPLWK